jgi:DNA mismatch repair protein MutS
MESGQPVLKGNREQYNFVQNTGRQDEVKDSMEDPPNSIQKGNVIAGGVSAELDELREILYSGKDYLVKLQQRESEKPAYLR